MLAKQYGVGNTLINLEKQQFSYELLLDTAKRFDHQTYLFYHPDFRVLEEKFKNHDYWSGFLGGEVAGSHFPKWETSDTTEYDTKKKFLLKNSFVKSVTLVNKPLDSLIPLLDGENIIIDNLSLYEKLDLFNRQTKFIAPHVCPNGFRIITPFSSKPWLEFIMNVPTKLRRNMFLYKQIVQYSFPELFQYPVKDNFGLPLNTKKSKVIFRKNALEVGRNIGFNKIISNKFRKYFDFSDRIRSDNDLRKIVINEIYDLKHRQYLTWLDLDDILKAHFDKTTDHGKAIQVLTSLEIILKSLEM